MQQEGDVLWCPLRLRDDGSGKGSPGRSETADINWVEEEEEEED